MSATDSEFLLTLICPDRPGIVHEVSGFVLEAGGNILESDQYGDPQSHDFCMRVHFVVESIVDVHSLRDRFAAVAEKYGMDWTLVDRGVMPRVLVMASRFDHCLRDLLYRRDIGELRIDIPAVVSNHRDTYQLAASHDIPFHHLPVSRDNKHEQERKLLELVEQESVDFVVLARYMQILSTELCERMAGRVINIHHSFLPGFKGARPYHQAHRRGVKLIGATAHYVTADLDEGPIIEQDVARVRHDQSANELAAVGREIEMRVLARAVKLQSEHRIILTGDRTVVFG